MIKFMLDDRTLRPRVDGVLHPVALEERQVFDFIFRHRTTGEFYTMSGGGTAVLLPYALVVVDKIPTLGVIGRVGAIGALYMN